VPRRAEPRPYHHGDVPAAVLRETLALLEESGPAGVGFREVARRAGVAHTSVAHHFGDKAGLFTAVATDGFERLGEALAASVERGEGFLELGVAYVRFAVEHRGHFEVMFRPDLYRIDDPALVRARARTSAFLHGEATEISEGAAPEDDQVAAIAGWSIAHGLATLWITGNLPASLGDDPAEVTRRVARLLGR
jgi:AcrR family transcriptional regulator